MPRIMMRGQLFTSLLLFATALLATVSRSSAVGSPDDIAAGELCPGTGATDARLACLAKAYAPLLKFDSGEAFFPSSVDDFLPYIKIVNADGSAIAPQPQSLSSSNLESLAATPLTTFLTTVKPLKESETDTRFMLGRKPTAQNTVPIYTSIVRKEPGLLYDFVYYAFYPYNQGKLIANQFWGNHVGDWEHVTLRISFKYAANAPRLMQAYTSQHSGGECLTASNLTFVSNTPHPVFYVARGSHGAYNKPGRSVYQKIPLFGELADDHNGANAVEWETWNNVPVRVEGQLLAREWTWWGFNGRWGNREGPTVAAGQHILENGPAYPGVHTLTFQLDLPAFEDCAVLNS